ncbi:MAG: hypothetical protein ACOCP3_02335 [Halodesulfurarchaeum sp.]
MEDYLRLFVLEGAEEWRTEKAQQYIEDAIRKHQLTIESLELSREALTELG